jgi:hypothetical protein
MNSILLCCKHCCLSCYCGILAGAVDQSQTPCATYSQGIWHLASKYVLFEIGNHYDGDLRMLCRTVILLNVTSCDQHATKQ